VKSSSFLPVYLLITLVLSTEARSQLVEGGERFAPERLTAENYEAAERFLSWNVNPLVYNAPGDPQWLPGDRFWYRNPVAGGHEFIVVDAATGARERAFDHERMARVLTEATGVEYQALALPLGRLALADDGRGLGFELDRRRWDCDVIDYECERPATAIEQVGDGVLSPDGQLLAFRRGHDLWVQHLTTGEETRLTTDGEARYGYATDSEGWRRSPRPAVTWSPDSRRLFTHRLDERGVGEMVLWRTQEGRPVLVTYPYAVPGDTIVPLYERVVVDVPTRRVVRLQAEPDHQRTSSCCGMLRGDALGDVEWRVDGGMVAYASTSRDYNTVRLRVADPETGVVRDVLEETQIPFFESNASGRGVPNWRVLHDRGEVLWHSHRDGWHHLYVYDLRTGRELRRLTSGEWSVNDVMHVDEAGGRVYFTATGREAGRDPYHRHLYSVGLDGSGLTPLTPEEADHVVSFSPSGRYFVDSYSTLDAPPATVVRRADGSVVATIEEADVTDLLALDWPRPMPFTALARDGATEIHGVMYRPSHFDPAHRYPIINNIYPGPQVGSIGPRTFQPGRRGQAQALAELGFIVVQIDALGTPMRSTDIHAFYYGNLIDNGLEDQIAAMRQLAERHQWIDLERVGMYGHSGGGYATVSAMLRFPEFFHVGVASAGNHDNRGYTYYWGEKWHGPLVVEADGTDSYARQANHLLAENLQGRLLLSYGTMDDNVHPVTTLLLVDELIRHNKDFDLIVMPNRNHGYSNEPWWLRQTWDYFTRHLLGAEPPAGYRIRQ
jgi:dipeptidyl-peptidase 4